MMSFVIAMTVDIISFGGMHICFSWLIRGTALCAHLPLECICHEIFGENSDISEFSISTEEKY